MATVRRRPKTTALNRSKAAATRMGKAVSKVKKGVAKKKTGAKVKKLARIGMKVKQTFKDLGVNKIKHDKRQIQKMKKKLKK